MFPIISSTGTPSVMHTISGTRASAASRRAAVANRAGTKITLQSAPVFFTASATVSNTGMPSTLWPPLPGRDAAHDLRAVLFHGTRVKRSVPSRDALHDDARVLADEDAHAAPFTARATTP